MIPPWSAPTGDEVMAAFRQVRESSRPIPHWEFKAGAALMAAMRDQIETVAASPPGFPQPSAAFGIDLIEDPELCDWQWKLLADGKVEQEGELAEPDGE